MSELVAELRKVHAEITESDGGECGLMALVRQAADRIDALEERLEINHYFKVNALGVMTRVDCEPGVIAPYDGISCRNETIKLQDQTIDKLLAQIKELKATL